MTGNEIRHLAVKTIPCDRCGAIPGMKCRTVRKKRATRPHQARVQPLYDMLQAGIVEGLGYALSIAEHRLDPDKATPDVWADIEKFKDVLRDWIGAHS